MNIDDNSGLVRPFMQRQKYTFPVLAAANSYVGATNIAIPPPGLSIPKANGAG